MPTPLPSTLPRRLITPTLWLIVVAAASGCASHCLRGACPTIGHPATDEMFALMRRELKRAESGSALKRARILETLPSLFPDVSRPDVPSCARELVDRLAADTFGRGPVRYDRLLIARIRAVGRVIDTTEVMDAKAAFLLKLATLPDARLTAYRLSPEETGPPPPKSLVREQALAYLVWSNLQLNVASVRDFLTHRMRESTDDRELVLLIIAASRYFENSMWGDGAPSLISLWIPDLRRRLQGPRDPRSFEIAITRLIQIGAYAQRFGAGPDALALVQDVVAARGRFPLTEGDAAAAHDLEVAALGARYDLQTANTEIGGNWEFAPARQLFDPTLELLREPAAGRVSVREVAARVAELDAELGQLRVNTTRCHVLAERDAWLDAGEAERRFAGLVAPIFDPAGRVRFNGESLCRMRVALASAQVSEERRIALLLRLLQMPLDRITDYDASADPHDPFVVVITGKPAVRGVAAHVLAGHLDWIDHDPALRAWLEQQALQPSPDHNDFIAELAWSALQPALQAVLSRAESPAAEAIVRAFIEDVRATLLRKDITSMSPGQVARARMLVIASYAPAHALETDARLLFDQILDPSESSPFASRYAEAHNGFARTATIARGLLAGTTSDAAPP